MASNAWVRVIQPNTQARMRLFCFPYAGGGASIYRTWRAHFADYIEVCSIQLPGREERLREAPFTHLDSLVETLVAVLCPYLDLPFVLFGHSLGALIGYEFTQQLRCQLGLSPMVLIVSGQRAPHWPAPDPPLHELPSGRFLDAVQRRYGGIPEVVLQDAELRAFFAPLLRADLTLLETYRSDRTEPLNCPIIAFGGETDTHTSREALAAWRELTQASFALRLFPGGHFYLNHYPHRLLNAIAEVLTADACAARGPSPEEDADHAGSHPLLRSRLRGYLHPLGLPAQRPVRSASRNRSIDQ